MEWISVQDKLPTEIGWYKIKTPYGEFEAPFVNNSKGIKVWVTPDPATITHWSKK